MHEQARLFSWLRGFGRRRLELLHLTWLALAGLVLYLFELGKAALPDWDAAIYADVTKEMLEGHHWLTPYLNHQLFFQKPPLLYWAQMVTFNLFGMNEFAARLPSALAGVGVVLLVYAMTRRMAGPLAGVFAALVLLTTHLFDHSMRLGTTDALLCLCIYLTVYGYVRMREGDGRWFVLLCVGLGLGILAKGPAELVAPMAIGVDWFFRRERKSQGNGLPNVSDAGGVGRVGWRNFWLGMLALAVIVVPWHAWMLAHYGMSYIREYLGFQILSRASRPLQGNVGGPLFYLKVIGYGAFPWWLLGVVAGVKWIWRREWKYSLPWLLMGVTLGLYTAVQTKLYWYVLPFYPALAMEVGRLMADWTRKWRLVGYAAGVVILIGFGVGFWKLVSWPGNAAANEERALALAAKPGSGPLFVVGKPGPDTRLDIYTVLFYSGRDVEWQHAPDKMGKLAATVRQDSAVDAILLKSTANLLSQQYEVHSLVESGDAELARVSRKP